MNISSKILSISMLCLFTSVFYSCGINRFSTQDEVENFNYYDWTKVPMKEKSVCSDGSEYFLLSKKGKSKNLIIHFGGGGACWDAETCMAPITIPGILEFGLNGKIKDYYLSDIPNFLSLATKGIFENEKEENPLKDWNVVYLPYCTGDLHVGNTENVYTDEKGKSITIKHNGQNNVQEGLDWIITQFGNPEKILISGDSAGGFGAMMWTPTIADAFAASKIYQLSDCFFFETGEWTYKLNELWKINDSGLFNIPPGDGLLQSLLTNCKSEHPDITFLQINSLYDNVLGQFNAKLSQENNKMDDEIASWSEAMCSVVGELDQLDLSYHYYVTDYKLKEKKMRSPHTFIGNSRFYNCEQDDQKMTEWLRSCIVDDQPFSVGKRFLENHEVTIKYFLYRNNLEITTLFIILESGKLNFIRLYY